MPGMKLSHYRVLEKLFDEPTGSLFKAHDETLGRTVVLRLLPPRLSGDEAAKQRFLGEARVAGSLDHPNVAAVHEVGETEEGLLYIVTAWREGQTLQQRLRRGPLELADAVSVVADAARGLAAAHARGIVHRNVTPRSIWIGRDGTARLTDFGVAGLAAGRQTDRGAPEPLTGPEEDARSDISSLGAVLSECLSKEIPAEVGQVIERCLQRDPRDPYQTAQQVVEDLEKIIRRIPSRTGDRRRGLRGRPARVLLAAAAAILVAAAAAVWLWRAGVLGGKGEPARISIAVIPFDGSTLAPGDQWMAGAVTDDLIADFSQLKALRVISRNSSSQVKASDDPREAGRRLTAQFVASGSVSRPSGSIRIEARVVRCADGERIMESEYQSAGTNVQVLQDRVWTDTLARLGVHPTREEAKRIAGRKVISDAAFELFCRGRAFVSSFEPLKAIDYMSRVVAMEPDYADAWAYLAREYEDAVNLYAIDWQEGRRESREAIGRAVELNPESSYVHLTSGYLDFMREKKWAEAEANLRASIEENPSSPEAYNSYAWFLYVMGRPSEGDAMAQQAIALDPLWLFARDYYGLFLYFAREYDKSIEVLTEVLALDPNDVMAHYWITEPYVAKGMYQEALAEYEIAARMLDGTFFGDAVAVESYRVHGLMGNPDKARSLADKVMSRYSAADRWKLDDAMAYVWIAVGEKDAAFAVLNRMYDRGYAGSWLLLLRVAEWLDPLRGDARYGDLLRKMDLERE